MPDPAITANNPTINSHSTFAPVVARFTVGAVDGVGVGVGVAVGVGVGGGATEETTEPIRTKELEGVWS
jgi:hypothetical protein